MKIKKYLFLLAFCSSTLLAQESKPLSLSVEARGDYQREYVDGETQKDECGFKGNILNVILKGDISPKFSYSYRQRLSGINKDRTFFDATDWVYLNYKATENLTLTAGKQIVFVGGWELEPAPIDVYQLSEFCYNFPCYEWGVIATYNFSGGKDNLIMQICESPYQKAFKNIHGESGDMYAYNLMWYGKHGFFEPLWSVNMMEYAPGKYINYIALGNKLHMGRRVQLEFDYLNRASSRQTFFFRDCSVMGKLNYQPVEQLNLFAKVSYDVNKSGNESDLCVLDGTEITRIGGGVEYFPLKNDKVRAHAHYSYAFGNNTNPAGTLKDKQSAFNIGLTWRINVL